MVIIRKSCFYNAQIVWGIDGVSVRVNELNRESTEVFYNK